MENEVNDAFHNIKLLIRMINENKRNKTKHVSK